MKKKRTVEHETGMQRRERKGEQKRVEEGKKLLYYLYKVLYISFVFPKTNRNLSSQQTCAQHNCPFWLPLTISLTHTHAHAHTPLKIAMATNWNADISSSACCTWSLRGALEAEIDQTAARKKNDFRSPLLSLCCFCCLTPVTHILSSFSRCLSSLWLCALSIAYCPPFLSLALLYSLSLLLFSCTCLHISATVTSYHWDKTRTPLCVWM